jgi:Domain of unknown function (DUF6429)
MPAVPNGCRVWKEFDWDVMEPPRKKSFISDPAGKAKSVVLTEDRQRQPSASSSPSSSPPADDAQHQLQ